MQNFWNYPKVFALNNIVNHLSNLWCIILPHLNPVIINPNKKYVSLTIDENGVTFGIVFVYASTCYIRKR